jgi:hypothetical protein
MDPLDARSKSGRQTFVSTILTVMAGFFFVFVLVLIGGSLVLYLVGIVAAIAAFGMVHYFLWGRLLIQQTNAEREEELLRERALAEDQPDRPDRPDERIRT